ncbi:hypothetical protein PHJA_001807400 [Phtheirospermum japonicum]|uniref:Uncharacterized protein n=1 Tax=Phtheirospermum japonicum TaxID=374723 RepID=A0A830CLC2_9LAMI|nr:hypothetical protein PHJA_001807400 [Phtheirospermum japonicum]
MGPSPTDFSPTKRRRSTPPPASCWSFSISLSAADFGIPGRISLVMVGQCWIQGQH